MAAFQTTSSTSGAPYFSNTDPFQTAYSPGGDPFRTAYALRTPPSSQGVGAPPSSSYMVYAAEVTSSHADELVKSLAQQREADVQQAAVVTARELPAKTAFIGDRGSLTHHTGLQSPVAASVSPTRPTSEATVVGVGAVIPSEEIAGLSQDVAAKEMELRVLRQQAETTQRDADRLRSRLRDANLRLQQASGLVGTLAAKVEVTAGRSHQVLDASAQQVQEQVAGFRRRLARMEFELKDKEKDIQDLRLVLAQGQEKSSGHRDRVAAVQQGKHLDGEPAKAGVDTAMAVSVWKDANVARIEQEQANTALARERRATLEQHDAVDEEINAIRNSIHRMEQKCKYHTSEAASKQQRRDALVMEERLCQSAAQLGAERAAEQKRNFAAEERYLRQRIADEQGRLGAKSAQGSAYDVAHREALSAQMQLQALTMCVKEVSRTLRGPSGGAGDHVDRLDQEVDAWIRKAREARREVPALRRVGAGEYVLDGQPLYMAVSNSGQLCARLPDGGLLPVEAYFRHVESLKRQEAASATAEQPATAPATYGVQAGPKPLHAMVSPMTISLASPPVVA